MAKAFRIALFFAGSALLYLVGGRLYGPILVGLLVAWWLVSRSILPRMAHRAFLAGNYPRARLFYRVLRWLTGPRARTSILISLAACAAAEGKFADALALLDSLDPNTLTESARAVWHNNRSYALARSESDPGQALAGAEEALRLRPGTIGFRHTRATALIALGRYDEAITELESAWREEAVELPATFEAERCYDLGRAWHGKGEVEYGGEYFQRSWKASPESLWGQQAGERISPRLPTFDREL